MTSCVCLYSGGADSAVLLHQALTQYDEVHTLTFNYNQRHKKEIEVAKRVLTSKPLVDKVISSKFVDMSFFASLASSSLTDRNIEVVKMKDVIGEPQPKNYVPNRNMTMLSIAASYAESIKVSDILTAIVALDNLSGYYDCTPEFVQNFNNVIALNRLHRIEVKSPLVTLSKAEIINLGFGLGVNFANTWTCYEGREISCSSCPSCAGRIKGFIDAGRIDPLPYEVAIPWEKYKCVE